MKPIVFEMETSDPDDFLTLLWLADHPEVDLKAVCVTPGGKDQLALVRWALDTCGRDDVPAAPFHDATWWHTAEGAKPRVSGFHYKVYGEAPRTHWPRVNYTAANLLAQLMLRYPDLTVLVGSPPKATAAAFNTPLLAELGCWVQQGGFAGDSLVEPKDRLEKFAGRETCPSFNPGGAPKQTLALLASERVRRRVFVSKNVCHGVTWNADAQTAFAERIWRALRQRDPEAAVPDSWRAMLRTGLRMMMHGLDCYLRDKGVAKAMHDLVAAAVALDESVCTLKEVEIYRRSGEWGAKAASGTNTFITTAIDMDRFVEVLAR